MPLQLLVSATIYNAVVAQLKREGRDPETRLDNDRWLSLDEIEIRPRDGRAGFDVTIGSSLSAQDRRGRVEIQFGPELIQIPIEKARELAGMLNGAIEAATSDEMMWRLMTESLGLDERAAAVALVRLRELRQGSAGVVYPS